VLDAGVVGVAVWEHHGGRFGRCDVRERARIARIARAPPIVCAITNAGTDAGAIPANVFEKIRPTLIAGFAKLLELVKK
jgi:hypothetical protein